MRIRYLTKSSRFVPAIADAIDARGGEVDGKWHINLVDGGYHGRVIVDIDSRDREEFWCDWEGADATRFPARIRAAATALRDCRRFGRFLIEHADGLLSIACV